MESEELEKQKYPVGRFTPPPSVSAEQRKEMISHVAQAPRHLKQAIAGLTDEQLKTPYREGGWTVQQVAHHLADSHMNAIVRFKWTLTEESPTIKAYDQNKWALLADSLNAPVARSVALLEELHARWGFLLDAMSDEDFARHYIHPEGNRVFRLDTALALYSWHSLHHVAQITALRERRSW